MTNYEPSTPRAACALAAVAMSALTFALMVGLPAASGPDFESVYAEAATEPTIQAQRATAGPGPTTSAADCKQEDSLQARTGKPPYDQQS